MNKSLFIPYFIVVIVIYIALSFSKEKYEAAGKKELEKRYGKTEFTNISILGASPRNGKIYLEDITGLKIINYSSKSFIALQRQGSIGKYTNYVSTVIRKANIAAYASDHMPYFSNGFLIGYSPYKTTSIWEPMQIISQRLKYAYDKELFNGSKEIWQTSKEAYKRLRGDCEDHALLLADWLISMGHDAKVVLGKYRGRGHAWVILFYNNQEFLIETTSKRSHFNHYPLAKLIEGYVPEAMFDRNSYWRKMSGDLKDYSNGWKKTSTFEENL